MWGGGSCALGRWRAGCGQRIGKGRSAGPLLVGFAVLHCKFPCHSSVCVLNPPPPPCRPPGGAGPCGQRRHRWQVCGRVGASSRIVCCAATWGGCVRTPTLRRPLLPAESLCPFPLPCNRHPPRAGALASGPGCPTVAVATSLPPVVNPPPSLPLAHPPTWHLRYLPLLVGTWATAFAASLVGLSSSTTTKAL